MAQRTCWILWIFQLEKYLEIVHHLKNICILFNFTTTSLEKKAEWMISVFRIFKLTVWKNKRNGSLIAVESLYISCRLICVLDEKGWNRLSLLDGSYSNSNVVFPFGFRWFMEEKRKCVFVGSSCQVFLVFYILLLKGQGGILWISALGHHSHVHSICDKVGMLMVWLLSIGMDWIYPYHDPFHLFQSLVSLKMISKLIDS